MTNKEMRYKVGGAIHEVRNFTFLISEWNKVDKLHEHKEYITENIDKIRICMKELDKVWRELNDKEKKEIT